MAREAAGRQDEQGAAWADANDAYANELLPCLLGGEWVVSRRGVFRLVGLNLRPLFDHPGCFRRKGIRGPNRWDNCAIVAHPYNLDGADQQLAELRRQGVGVLVGDELSAWNPGSTVMTIAAADLHRRPVPAGFRLLETDIRLLEQSEPPIDEGSWR